MWRVHVPKRAHKASQRLPSLAQETLWLLVKDLRENGPVAGNWPNYSKLSGNRHLCHIKNVSAWWEVRNEKQTIEVTYVGTYENAPY